MKSSFVGFLALSLFASVGMVSIPHAAEAQNAPVMPNAETIVTFVNAARKSAGLPPFTENSALMQAALLKAQSLAPTGVLTHTTSANGVLWWPLLQAGYFYQAAGENLAANILDPQTLVTAWMNSPTHRANIVNPLYTDIGIGVAEGIYDGVRTDFVVEYTATPKPIPVSPILPVSSVVALSKVDESNNEFVTLQSYASLIADYILNLTAKKAQAAGK